MTKVMIVTGGSWGSDAATVSRFEPRLAEALGFSAAVETMHAIGCAGESSCRFFMARIILP